jgi:hypothetical protein
MLRMDHGPLGVLPDNRHWGQPPRYGFIGVSAFVVKREVWQRHAPAFGGAQYWSDFDFISSVWRTGPAVYWHDVVGSIVQRISNGEPEHG